MKFALFATFRDCVVERIDERRMQVIVLKTCFIQDKERIPLNCLKL